MLNNLRSPKTKKGKVQKGRGYGSGHGGHTVGRGTKGQKSRSGYSRPRPGFEGGQMPLARRLPILKGFSRGFATANTKRYELQLSEVAEALKGNKVNIESLAEAGLIVPTSKKVSIKILFDKEISNKLDVEGISVSQTAKNAIEKAGGQVI